MPRPKNEELSARVRAAMMRQLFSRGIAATSYASIARESGTTRTVVQTYYPHKSDMADEFSRITTELAMETTEPAYREIGIEDEEAAKVAHLFLSGSVYFELMQRDEGRRALLAELLRNRDLSQNLIFLIAERSYEEIGRQDVVEDPAYRNDIVMSIGGLFELFYYHLKHGMHFDSFIYYGQMTRVWMRDAGFTEERVADVLSQSARVLEDIDALVGEMETALRQRHYL